MKAKQKTIIRIFIFVLILMLLFPITYSMGFPDKYDYKYMFIISVLSQKCYTPYEIHTGLYFIQITLVSMIFALTYYLNKD